MGTMEMMRVAASFEELRSFVHGAWQNSSYTLLCTEHTGTSGYNALTPAMVLTQHTFCNTVSHRAAAVVTAIGMHLQHMFSGGVCSQHSDASCISSRSTKPAASADSEYITAAQNRMR